MSPRCVDSLSLKHTHTHTQTLKIAKRKTQPLKYKAGGEPVPLCRSIHNRQHAFTLRSCTQNGSCVILSKGKRVFFFWNDVQ